MPRRLFRFLSACLLSMVLLPGLVMAETYSTTYRDAVSCDCAVFGPFCLRVERDGTACTVLRARTQSEFDRLRPIADTENAYMACQSAGGGYSIAGECRDISAGEAEEHFTQIAQKRAAAVAKCAETGLSLGAATESWKGMFSYSCSDGSGSDDLQTICKADECFDDAAFGMGGCRASPGCPGGTNRCGSTPACP